MVRHWVDPCVAYACRVFSHLLPLCLKCEWREELVVSIGPADGVQMLPEGAIKGEGVEGGVHLAEVTEVHGGEEGEHTQQQLWGEVQEGGRLHCICTDKHVTESTTMCSP